MAIRNKKGTLIGDVADTRRGKASNLPSVKPPKTPRIKKVVPRDHRAGTVDGPSYGHGRRLKGKVLFEHPVRGKYRASKGHIKGGSMRSSSSSTRAMDRLSKGRSKKR